MIVTEGVRGKREEAGRSEVERLKVQLAERNQRISQLEDLNQELEKEIQDLMVIGEVARSITGSLLIEDILKKILYGIRQCLPLDQVLLSLIKAEEGLEEVKLAVGVPKANLKKSVWKVDDGDPVWRELKEKRAPLLVEAEAKAVPDWVRSIFSGEFVKAPMVVQDEVIGTVMASGTTSKISRRDLRLLAILVEYACIAVENARLYYDVIRSEEKLKKTQGQLVEAERLAAIGQLAVSINHEINNPLCTISMSCQLLKMELENRDPEIVERLENMEGAVQRIMDVTQKVSKMNKMQATEYLPNQMMIDLK